MHTLSRCAVMALAPLFSIAVGCTSSNPIVDAGPNQEVCPTNIVTATTAPAGDAGEGVSSACHVPGYVCVVGFQCGNYTQQAACKCTLQSDNKTYLFDCTLAANGMAVPAGVTDPTTLCTPIDTAGNDGGACPSSDTTAMGMPCTESGEQCFYTGVACPGGSVNGTDVCQCTGNFTGDAGLSWACDLGNCP